MFRTLLVVGLLLAPLATAEARGFRFGFSPGRAVLRAGSVALERQILREIQRKEMSNAGAPQLPPMAPPAIPREHPLSTVKTPPVDLAHWCDNGQLVGTGTGFCVVKLRTSEPT